ncbi:MAG: hypothetical protein V1787_03185 [Candidatus Micrarchaeota archaeon]
MYPESLNASFTTENAGPMRYPSLAFDTVRQIPHVAWVLTSEIDLRNAVFNRSLYARKWDRVQWAPETGEHNFSNASNATIVLNNNESVFNITRRLYSIQVDSLGQPHVAGLFQGSFDLESYNNQTEVFYLYWNSAYGLWLDALNNTEENVTSNVSDMALTNSTFAVLALDSLNRPHIAWVEENNSQWNGQGVWSRVFYRKWNPDAGGPGLGAWVDANDKTGITDDLNVSKTQEVHAYPAAVSRQEIEAVSLALDSAGNPHIAWLDRVDVPCTETYQVYYRKWNPDADGPGLGAWVDANGLKGITADLDVSKLDCMDKCAETQPAGTGAASASKVKISLFESGGNVVPYVAYGTTTKKAGGSDFPVELFLRKWNPVFSRWEDMLGGTDPYSEAANVSKSWDCNGAFGYNDYILGMQVDDSGNPHVSWRNQNGAAVKTEVFYRKWDGSDWVDAEGRPGVTFALNVSSDSDAWNNRHGGEMRLNATDSTGVPFIVYPAYPPGLDPDLNPSAHIELKRWVPGATECEYLTGITLSPPEHTFDVFTGGPHQFEPFAVTCTSNLQPGMPCPPLTWNHTNATLPEGQFDQEGNLFAPPLSHFVIDIVTAPVSGFGRAWYMYFLGESALHVVDSTPVGPPPPPPPSPTPQDVPANLTYLQCPLFATGEVTTIKLHCVYAMAPCNKDDITINAVWAGQSDDLWIHFFEVFIVNEGVYEVTATNNLDGSTSACKINRVKSEPIRVPDFSLLLLPAVAFVAVLAIRRGKAARRG